MIEVRVMPLDPAGDAEKLRLVCELIPDLEDRKSTKAVARRLGAILAGTKG